MSSALWHRQNVTETGDGPTTLLFVHGLGTHQGIWRRMAQSLQDHYRVVLMDLAGCGGADRAAYDPDRYATLDGHADDVIAVAEQLRDRRLVLVVHSVACMIGLLADLKAPQLVDAHVMVAPSPRYLDAPGYTGGFDQPAIDAVLASIATDVRAWARASVPVFAGPSADPAHVAELVAAFEQADPKALAQFANVAFHCDLRAQLPQLVKPTLVLQCANDPVAPVTVGRYMQAKLPDCQLEVLPLDGHFPQMAAPAQCASAVDGFLASLGFVPPGRGFATTGGPASRG